MSNVDFLYEHEDKLKTNMGAWFAGERVVYRGKDLFPELGDEPWMRVFLYGITGRMLDDKQIKLFEGVWVLCASYPDPRLWNNRIGALAGATRSTGALGLGAAIATSEATLYGLGPGIKCIDFIRKVKLATDGGESIEKFLSAYLKKERSFAGYGRPLVNGDERVEPIAKLATELGYDNGAHYQLAYDVEEWLITSRRRMRMNVFAVIAGLVADQGFSNREFYLYLTACYVGGIIPCYIDAASKPEGCFFPLRCDRIQYEGSENRPW